MIILCMVHMDVEVSSRLDQSSNHIGGKCKTTQTAGTNGSCCA